MPKLSGPELLVLITQLLVLLGLAKGLGELCRKIKQPVVIGELLAGVILGPTILGAIWPNLFSSLFLASKGASIALDGIVSVGVIFLLMIVGLEVDLVAIAKQKKSVGWIGLLGIVIPLIMGSTTAWLVFPSLHEPLSRSLFALFIGAAMSISALPVIARVLLDLGLMKTSLGNVIIAVATINDTIGWLLFTVVLALSGKAEGHTSVIVTIILTLALAISSVTWLRTFMNWVLGLVARAFGTHGAIIGTTLVSMLLAALFTEYIGVHAVFGAFLMGVAVNGSAHLTQEIKHGLHDFTTHILAPLFFAAVGLKVNFLQSFDLKLVLILLVIAYVSKLLAGWIGGKLSGIPANQAWAVGLGIVARGGMGIILAVLSFNAGLISQSLFAALVVMALVTSMTSGFIGYFYKPERDDEHALNVA